MLRLPKILRRERSRGQGLVEFALIVPMLLLLLLITLDFGRAFMSYITLTNVTRVAANFGATNAGAFTGTLNTATYDAVVDRESAGLNCDLQPDGGGRTPPIPTYPSGTGLGGTSVAAMTCRFSMLTPFVTNFFGGPLPISASAEFPIRTGVIANIGGSTTLPPPGTPQAGFDFAGVSGGTIDGAGDVSGVGTVTVNVTNTSVNAQTWDWDWGDGSDHESDSVPMAHQYANPGVYVVTLTVTNPVGTSSRSRVVTVTAALKPVAGFYGTPVASPPRFTDGGGAEGLAIRGSLPLVVDFGNTSKDGTDYSWNFGDGGSSTQASPQHTYAELGVYSVTLDITAPPDGTPMTRTDYVTAGCVVPNFANTLTSAAAGTWTSANFSGQVTYQPVGGTKSSKTPPSPPKYILSQEGGNGGDFKAPTQKNKNSPWLCDDPINLRYTP